MPNGVLTIDDLKEAMNLVRDVKPCPYRDVICNERMLPDARLVPRAPSIGFGGIGIRVNNSVPDGYLLLHDGKQIVGIIGPNKEDAAN